MKPHKWHKEIKAWADGAEIEKRVGKKWQDCHPVWDENTEYRIKPQQQQSSCCPCKQTCSALKEPQYLYVYRHPQNSSFMFVDHYYKSKDYIGKIKLEDEASSSGDKE